MPEILQRQFQMQICAPLSDALHDEVSEDKTKAHNDSVNGAVLVLWLHNIGVA